ncbi:MAG: hypothetical protein K2V38_17985 [Gemmataceae bacterium]|nr:hypothetical protein [Gemmataceae bacterium]
MHLLPLSLGRLADLARLPRVGSGSLRFALDAVQLTLFQANTFEATATDTVALARVRGRCVAAADEYPLFNELASAPDTGTTALIPAAVWRRVFAAAKRMTARAANPACRSVAVRIGPAETAFGVTDGQAVWVDRAPNVTGRFPPCNETVERCLAAPASDRVAVDPELFGDVLRVAASFAGETPRVTIETNGPYRPFTLCTEPRDGLEFLGLLMPLMADGPPTPTTTTTTGDAGPSDEERIAALEREVASLKRQRKKLRARIAGREETQQKRGTEEGD